MKKPRTKRGTVEEITPAAGLPLRILLAEDIPPNQKLAATILRLRGHEVGLANNGREAVELAAHEDFDLVLMDVQMPEMDGFEATAAIRAINPQRRPRLPIVAMTAHALQADLDRCLAAGMDGYITKPIKARELIALVERLVYKAADNSAGPFDLDEAVRRCFDREMFHSMIDFFFTESGELIERMRAAIAGGNAAEVARAAHRLRGTVVYLGAKPTISAVQRVEQAAASDNWTAVASAVGQLEGEVQLLGQALAAHRQSVASEQ